MQYKIDVELCAVSLKLTLSCGANESFVCITWWLEVHASINCRPTGILRKEILIEAKNPWLDFRQLYRIYLYIEIQGESGGPDITELYNVDCNCCIVIITVFQQRE